MSFRHRTGFEYVSQLDMNSIRLVRFRKPGLTQPTAEISLELSIWPLEESEKLGYHALLYTWGPPEGEGCYTSSDVRPILLNGRKFHVYPNLHDALAQLQKSPMSEYYWVDAICINQTDETEKAAQVSMMGHVYSAAAQVNIWVGQGNEHTPMVVAMIVKLARIMESLSAIEQELGPHDDSRMEKLGLPSLTTKNWAPFVAFYGRNWFRRSWVIQEVTLARKVCLLWGDKGSISWQDLINANSLMNRLGLYRGLTRMQEGPGEDLKTPSIVYPAQMITAGALCKSQDLSETKFRFLLAGIEVLTGTDAWKRGTAPMLAWLVWRCRRSNATDQRDKVYSLLGIARHAATVKGSPVTSIKVDYTDSSTPATVFTAATRFILEECNHLGLISLASLVTPEHGEDLELTPNLPSWVPDLSTSAQHASTLAILGYASHFDFDASRYQEIGSLGLRILGSQLHVKAVRIGALSAVSTHVAPSLLYDWQIDPFAALLLQCPQRYIHTGELAIEAFWRTLILNTGTRGEHPASPELGPALEACDCA
ncbi:hypothetical protein ACHAPT_002276 [Fusarium lateritium]